MKKHVYLNAYSGLFPLIGSFEEANCSDEINITGYGFPEDEQKDKNRNQTRTKKQNRNRVKNKAAKLARKKHRK